MPQLLPKEPTIDRSNIESQVVGFDTQCSEDILSVLGCETTRKILIELSHAPATKSELAARVDTSIQNTSHHLESLLDAGLVEVVGEWYSEKGREMEVYGLESSPFVLVIGEQDTVADTNQSIPSEPTPQLSD